MDTSRWKSGDEFPILDFVASFEFRSESSISFYLGTKSDCLKLTDMHQPEYVGPGSVFTTRGWLDVHHPCAGHIKTQVRVCLPEKYHHWEQMRDLVQQVMAKLGIPADETYEANFLSPAKQAGIEQARDRHGMTDRLY